MTLMVHVLCRELTFRKGETVYIIRQIDNNWYEGEHRGLLGIFPISYVEVSVCSLLSFLISLISPLFLSSLLPSRISPLFLSPLLFFSLLFWLSQSGFSMHSIE